MSTKSWTDAGTDASRPAVISPQRVGDPDRDDNEAAEGGRCSPPPLKRVNVNSEWQESLTRLPVGQVSFVVNGVFTIWRVNIRHDGSCGEVLPTVRATRNE